MLIPSAAALQNTIDPTGEEVAALERRVAERERDLVSVTTELQQLQARYLSELGSLYAELTALDQELAQAEIKAGLRVPDAPEGGEAEGPATLEPAGCSSTSAPSNALKAMFRDIARAVHPDAAPAAHTDERTRYRRHSLMAEANRAYAERDEDRLRLILRAWKLDEDAATCADPEAERARLHRRAAAFTERLAALDADFDALRSSAIARLKTRIDEARRQGWDLFAEMVRQIKREIEAARIKLARLGRADRQKSTTEARRGTEARR
jgi:hypothetical protein